MQVTNPKKELENLIGVIEADIRYLPKYEKDKDKVNYLISALQYQKRIMIEIVKMMDNK